MKKDISEEIYIKAIDLEYWIHELPKCDKLRARIYDVRNSLPDKSTIEEMPSDSHYVMFNREVVYIGNEVSLKLFIDLEHSKLKGK